MTRRKRFSFLLLMAKWHTMLTWNHHLNWPQVHVFGLWEGDGVPGGNPHSKGLSLESNLGPSTCEATLGGTTLPHYNAHIKLNSYNSQYCIHSVHVPCKAFVCFKNCCIKIFHCTFNLGKSSIKHNFLCIRSQSEAVVTNTPLGIRQLCVSEA